MGTKLTPETSAQAGFSLIELLVVISVLSVLSVGAVISTGRGGPDAAATDMARFQDTFTTLRALAIQGRETRGLVVQGKGMRHARRADPSDADGWDISDNVQPWRSRVAFNRRNEAYVPNAPDIHFLANGRTSVFSIGFAAGGRCASDGWSGLTCDAR